MKSAKRWMGWLAAGLAVLATGRAGGADGTENVRFQGGHPWLSRERYVVESESLQNPSEEQPATSDNVLATKKGVQATTPKVVERAGRIFDLTVSMYKHRDEGEQKKIEKIFEYFARGVYQATKGKHKIGTVRIVECNEGIATDIVWEEKGRPRAHIFGAKSGGHISMFDEYNAIVFSAFPMYAGYALAHEWGHYRYGFGDEYDESNRNNSVLASLMGEIPKEHGAFDYESNGMNYFMQNCNLSVSASAEHHAGTGWWIEKTQTKQFALWYQSCLQLLVSPNTEPFAKDQFKWTLERYGQKEKDYLWPEFSGIDPKQLPTEKDAWATQAAATKELHVLWPEDVKLMWAICLDHSGSMDNGDLELAKARTKLAIDQAPAGTLLGIFAFADSVINIVPFTEVTDANRTSLKKSVDSFTPGGGTALWKAAYEALGKMAAIDPEHNNIGSLLLMTDGEDTASGSITKGMVVDKCREMGVAFNSIAYGKKADIKNLQEVADGTGGKNVSATDSLASINDAFCRLLNYGSSRVTIVDEKGTTSASSSWSASFEMDSSGADMQVTMALSVPSQNTTVTLLSPSGIRYAANSTTDVGNESSFVFTQARPEAGRWSVIVLANPGTEVSCFVDASAQKVPSRLSLWVDDSDSFVFASLSYDDPVDGAVVKALIHEDSSTREVYFKSIGGGMYKLALADCGPFMDGFTVRADATKGFATYTYVNVMDYEGDGERTPIPESFTRSEWLDLSRFNGMPVRFVEVHPRWPWEGKVDIDFTVAPTDRNTKVSANLTGIDNRTGYLYPLSSVTCDDTLSELSRGSHRLTWNAAADYPGRDFEDFSIRFDVALGTALGAVTEVTASEGTYFDGVHLKWYETSNATTYRIYRSETADGTGRTLLATTEGDSVHPITTILDTITRTYVDTTAVIGKKYYYYWVQPIMVGSDGKVKYEGPLTVSGSAWRCPLGGVSYLTASSGDHYDGVHLSWTGPNGATSYRIYRGTTANASSKTLLTTTSSTYYIDTSAAQLQKYYYYWVEPVAVLSGTTYTGAMNTTPVSGWRNKLGTPTFHFANWRPGYKSRPDIDLYIDNSVLDAKWYEYMSGDQSKWWSKMDKVVAGTLNFNDYDGGKGTISSSASPQMATIGWGWAFRYSLKVYVRAANNEGVGDWVKWNLADHLKESAFKNSEFYKIYPKP